jgi:hypothetical protein
MLDIDIVWIVECKHWKTAVSKLHVLDLREIVSDIGADRGFCYRNLVSRVVQ